MTWLMVFALSLIQNFLATKEIAFIARSDTLRATLWAGLSSTASCAIMILVVVSVNRWALLVPFVLGDVIATYLALRGKSK